MSRICTSIDQSNKLIKLGIDVNTADMYYAFLNRIDKYATVPTVLDEEKYVFINDIPAWSLSALMDLMPNINGHYPELCRGKLTGEYYMWIEGIFDTQTFNNPIDSAFEMICWFLENKEI